MAVRGAFDGLSPAPGVAHAQWVVDSLVGGSGIAGVVPAGFEAYARPQRADRATSACGTAWGWTHPGSVAVFYADADGGPESTRAQHELQRRHDEGMRVAQSFLGGVPAVRGRRRRSPDAPVRRTDRGRRRDRARRVR